MRVRMVQDSVVTDDTGHFLHVCTNFVRHACCHCVYDVISAFTIRRVCAQLLQGSARNVVNGMQKFGVIGLQVANIGDASTNAVGAHCVQHEVDRMARK